jgi:hypothetical protein
MRVKIEFSFDYLAYCHLDTPFGKYGQPIAFNGTRLK